MTHQPVPHPLAQPTIWEPLAESRRSAVVPLHSQLREARCTHRLIMPAQADCMTRRKLQIRSLHSNEWCARACEETLSSTASVDILFVYSCSTSFSHSILHYKKTTILNKDKNFLLLQSTCSSLQGISRALVKDLLVFWPPVDWDTQKICATSAGTFKWTCAAPAVTYIGLIKIYQPGKSELSYLEKQPTSLLILRQCVTVFIPACLFPLLPWRDCSLWRQLGPAPLPLYYFSFKNANIQLFIRSLLFS